MKFLTKLFNYFRSVVKHPEDAAIIRRKSGKKLSRKQLEALLAYDEMLLALVTEPAYRSYKQRFNLAAGLAAELRLDQSQAQDYAE